MREIKFNIWDIEKQKMFRNAFKLTKEGIQQWIQFERDSSDNLVWLQYTGLKDKNGKEIYEGDIIEYTQHYFNTDMQKLQRKKVEWKYDRWSIYETNAGESNIEIIGNIHENPRLYFFKR